ncbi:MAG TPA: histidine kinase, partial [Gemmatimonadaceae bacterium]|nr:histidine kinase [Gemmatimonadaceae bacterium]
LYNTLNLIAELVHEEPEAADEMLTHLGALLRRSYRESPQLVPLQAEIDFGRAYAEILARRYRGRVNLTIDVPAELRSHPVPAFLLQPLVENAFRHGVERREQPSAVQVTAETDHDSLVVRVCDRVLPGAREQATGDGPGDGPGNGPVAPVHSPDAPDRTGDGIGLRNTRERLELLYGSAAGLAVVSAPDETVASAWVPLAPADRRADSAHDSPPTARETTDALAAR